MEGKEDLVCVFPRDRELDRIGHLLRRPTSRLPTRSSPLAKSPHMRTQGLPPPPPRPLRDMMGTSGAGCHSPPAPFQHALLTPLAATGVNATGCFLSFHQKQGSKQKIDDLKHLKTPRKFCFLRQVGPLLSPHLI